MNGKKLLLDTNAIIYLLAGNKGIGDLLKSAEWVGISVISWIEFMAFTGLRKRDEQLFAEFLKRIVIIGIPAIDDQLVNRIIVLRKKYAIKIPDAIIGATAIKEKCGVTNCRSGFSQNKRIKGDYSNHGIMRTNFTVC